MGSGSDCPGESSGQSVSRANWCGGGQFPARAIRSRRGGKRRRIESEAREAIEKGREKFVDRDCFGRRKEPADPADAGGLRRGSAAADSGSDRSVDSGRFAERK